MTLNYTLTKEELYNFHKKHILDTMQYKQFSSQFKKMYFLIGMLVWLGVEFDIKFEVFIGLVIVGIILAIFKKKIYLHYFHSKIIIMYSKYDIEYLFDPIKITVNDEGILLYTSVGDELIKWKGIKDFNIIDGNVFIRTFSKNNIFIPQSVVMSENYLNSLKDLFMKYGEIKAKNAYPKDMKL